MITNALNKFYSDHLNTQHTVCSSILKKIYLKNPTNNNNEKRMISKGDIKFINEIQLEPNNNSIEKDVLITNYLSGASVQNSFEYKLAVTETNLHDSELLNDEISTSSYNLNPNENLNLKKKISNKLKELSLSKTNDFTMFNLFSTNCNSNSKENNDLVDQNSISSNSNCNLSDECCSSCSVTNTTNRMSMFDEQTLDNNKAENTNNDQSDNDITYSIDDLDLKEDNQLKTESKIYETIEVAIHRLPGENMGIDFSVQTNGNILIENIIENGAASRAIQHNGIRCPIKQYDEIIEINNVLLSNMKSDEIILMISELPLYIQLKLRRQTNEFSISSSEDLENENVPLGYNIHCLFVTSMSSIKSSNLESNSDGYFKLTKMMSNKEEELVDGDILYMLNEHSLHNKTKNDILDKFKSINQISELKILRKLKIFETKTNNPDGIPYYNGVFAKNSIKLAMRSSNYEQSNVIAFNKYNKSRKKLFDFINKSEEFNSSKLENQVDTEINTAHLNEQSEMTSKFEISNIHEKNKREDIFCVSDQTLTSIHDDNWIFLDRKPSIRSNCSSIVDKNVSQNNLNIDDTNDLTNGFFFTNKMNEEDSSASSIFNEAGTIKSLTSSSCHSERSVARLDCVTLCEANSNEDKQSTEMESNKFLSTLDLKFAEETEKLDKETIHKSKYDQENENILDTTATTTSTSDSNKSECLIVKKFFSKLKSISEEKAIESSKTSQEIKSINSLNNSFTRKYELCDLKRVMHNELVQLITDNNSNNNINKLDSYQGPPPYLTNSVGSSTKLNSLIRKIHSKPEDVDDRAKEIEKKINNFQQPTTVLSHVGRESTLLAKPPHPTPPTNQLKPLSSILKNSNENLSLNYLNKPKNVTYVDSACNRQNNKKIILNNESPFLNETILKKEKKALSEPSLVEDSNLQLSVKEKIKLFMNQSKPETNRNLFQNHHGSFNYKLQTNKNDKPRPLSQVLTESLKLKTNPIINRGNNLSFSINKLNKPELNYKKMNPFFNNNCSNKKIEILTIQHQVQVKEEMNDETNCTSVKDKIAYFSSKSNNNNNRNDYLIKKKSLDFRKRY